jgi:hypothetical protein
MVGLERKVLAHHGRVIGYCFVSLFGVIHGMA